MRDQLLTAWRARRVLIVSHADCFSAYMQALLTALEARPARIAPEAGAAQFNQAMTEGRIGAVIVPDAGTLSSNPCPQAHLSALLSLLDEARESGVPLVILCSCAGVYRAADRPWIAQERDPIGGETYEGLVQSLLQLTADGVSRGLLGDAVSVIIARHLPCLGCGHPAVAACDAWCDALDADEMLRVAHPSLQGVYLHPLDVCCGALALGARFLLGDRRMTGAFNLAADAHNLMANRTAALRFIRQNGGTRPILETEPPRMPSLPLLDGARARLLCGVRTMIPGDEALGMLLTLRRAGRKSSDAQTSAIIRQAQTYAAGLPS